MDGGVSGKLSDKWYRCLVFLCIGWGLYWALLPLAVLGSDYIDILENLEWSRHFQFGYDKNPYFGAWITQAGYVLTGRQTWINYFLSQLSVIICFFCVWKLARELVKPREAFLSVLFLLGILYYSTRSLEFNDDVLEISLWALTILYFYRSLEHQRLRDWLLVGLCGGLAFMTKYYGALLFVSMAVLLLFTAAGRSSFRRPGLYWCIGIIVALSIPNMVWLYQNKFIAFGYALDRATVSTGTFVTWKNHLLEPWLISSRLLGELAFSLIAFAVVFFLRDHQAAPVDKFKRQFVTCICWGPPLLTLLFSVITGGTIKCSWLTPCFSLLGLFMVIMWRPVVTDRKIKLFAAATVVYILIVSGYFCWVNLYIQPYQKTKCSYENFPGMEISRDLTALWRSEMGNRQLRFVVANREEACNIAVYSDDRPQAFFSANPMFSQWIKEEELHREGALIIWKGGHHEAPSWFTPKKFPPERCKVYPVRTYRRAVPGWFAGLLRDRKPQEELVSCVILQPQKN